MASTLKRAPLEGTTLNTNAETKYLETGKWNGNSGTLTFQVVVTKGTGTVAGTVTPQYSLDGTNFIAIPGTSAFTLTDVATQSQIWSVTDRKALYYRLAVATTGTVTATSFALFLEDDNEA